MTKIDQRWVKEKQEEQAELELEEDKEKKIAEKIETEKRALMEANSANASNTEKVDLLELDNILGTDERIQRQDSNEYFNPSSKVQQSKVVKSTPVQSSSSTTRSSLLNPSLPEQSTPLKFPEIPVRSGYRSLNMNIAEVMVNMECRFKIEQRQVAPCLAYIMNTLAGQKWEFEKEEVVETEPVEENKEATCSKRKRAELGDLTFLLPSRKSLHHRLEDASLMSFKYVAETIQKTNAAGGTVTAGTDDTVKASGHRVHDAKTGRITCVNETTDEDGRTKRVRQTFTTGFTPNISHSGEDSATSVRSVIGQMAVLCSVQYEEMQDFIDFFMTDRAGDADTMLDHLGVSEWQRLKCNAHPLLAIQNALDGTFKNQET